MKGHVVVAGCHRAGDGGVLLRILMRQQGSGEVGVAGLDRISRVEEFPEETVRGIQIGQHPIQDLHL